MSSGNLLADRRYEWARELAARGDHAGAADLLAQALELAPGYAAAWFALGEARALLADRGGAVAAWQQALDRDPTDRHGASLHLARLGATLPDAMPPAYVRALFDGYAPAFDTALRDRLAYCAPDLLLRAITAARGEAQPAFAAALDLGCGTGLAGAVLRPLAARLVGVDLSPAMLAQARGKGLYDRLAEDDIARFLSAEAAADARYDLVVAADVFVYVNDLAPLFAAAAAVLAADGLLAFTVETHDGDGVVLRETLRYAHGAAYVYHALRNAGLRTASLEPAVTRREKDAPVPGLVVVATR